jgi:hypothetical protein
MKSFLTRVWTFLAGRLDFREKVVGPVVVNLVTALIFFVVLATGKRWIYPLIFPTPGDREYPINVSVEGFNVGDYEVAGEIYIANLVDDPLSDAKLHEWLDAHKDWNPNASDDRIIVEWQKNEGEMSLVKDEDFNKNKGNLEVLSFPQNPRKWSIRVKDINRRALLRVNIRTKDYQQPVSRADRSGLPFSIQTPRRY